MPRALGWTIAAAHMALVGFGAAGKVPIPETNALGRVVESYRAYTGADNGFGFFAPGVAAQRRVILHVFAQGEWRRISESFSGVGSSLRLTTLTGLFSESELREAVAASWAARALGSVQGAEVVIVEVEVYLTPTMTEYRAGARPRWITECAFPFTRHRDGLAVEEPPDAPPAASR